MPKAAGRYFLCTTQRRGRREHTNQMGQRIPRQFGSDGADTFMFTALKDSTTKGKGRDTIEDFNTSDLDKIDLSHIDAKKGFHFIGTAHFHHKKGELHYVVKNGDATVEGDVNGDGKADFAILLKHVTSLAATDFDL
jgi:serralysin